jgi:hypothetical protein
MTGRHEHDHSAGDASDHDDGVHMHPHTHNNDADHHGHEHADGDVSGSVSDTESYLDSVKPQDGDAKTNGDGSFSDEEVQEFIKALKGA